MNVEVSHERCLGSVEYRIEYLREASASYVEGGIVGDEYYDVGSCSCVELRLARCIPVVAECFGTNGHLVVGIIGLPNEIAGRIFLDDLGRIVRIILLDIECSSLFNIDRRCVYLALIAYGNSGRRIEYKVAVMLGVVILYHKARIDLGRRALIGREQDPDIACAGIYIILSASCIRCSGVIISAADLIFVEYTAVLDSCNLI